MHLNTYQFFILIAAVGILQLGCSDSKPELNYTIRDHAFLATDTLQLGGATIGDIGKILADEEFFYISDKSQLDIKAFNRRNHTLAFSLGSQGRGPGEFLDIRDFILYEDDEKHKLLALDGEGNKIEVFDREQTATTFTLPETTYNYRGKILPFYTQAGLKFMILSFSPTSLRDNCAFYQFDSAFKTQETCFGKPDSFIDVDDPIDLNMSDALSGSFFIHNRILYFSPYIYRGEIYRYQYMPETNKWERMTSVFGHTNGKEAIEENVDDPDLRLTSYGKRYRAYLRNFSLGFFEQNNSIYHTTITEKANRERFIGIEEFPENDNIRTYQPFTLVSNTPDTIVTHNISVSGDSLYFFPDDRRYIILKAKLPGFR